MAWTVTLLVLLSGACSEDETYYLEPVVEDADGDGLLDQQELEFGTSPLLADTDGDGFSDYVECIEYDFDPEVNPVEFNPRVADVPQLGIQLTSPPAVALHLTDTEGHTRSFETSRGEESAKTATTSNTDTNSHAVEQTHTASVEVGFSGWSMTGKVSYSYSNSTTDTQTYSYTEEQSNENRQTLENSETFETANEIAASGAILMVTAQIQNRGHMAFRIENLILGAVLPDLTEPGVFTPVGNLVLDTAGNYTSFPKVTIGPGGKLEVLNFINDGLDLETGKALLQDSSSLAILASSYELVDAKGQAFAFNLTDVRAKTASVIIDYAGLRPSERFMVATNADPESDGITVREALHDILRLPYEAGEVEWEGATRSGLVCLHDDDGVRVDPERFAYWLVVHVRDQGYESRVTGYDMLVEDYDFDDIVLESGDALHLVYIEDKDGDGLWSREEFLRGSNDESLDSDQDGVSDAEEVALGCSPGLSDTDGDGINDGVEVAAGLDPLVRNRTLVTTGESNSFALLADRSLWAWGRNGYGQLGVGGDEDQYWPTEVAGEAGWMDVSSARYYSMGAHSLGVREDGTLWGWGSNLGYPLGEPSIGAGSDVPAKVGGDRDWMRVFTGLQYSLGLKENGTLWAWGNNDWGQLGTGDLVPRETPSIVLAQDGSTPRWLDVAAARHSVAIRADGTLWTTGNNECGQLALGDAVLRTRFTQVGSDNDWAQVSAGFAFTLALKTDSTLYYAGCTPGLPPGVYTYQPTLRALGTGWKEVSAGNELAIGIRTDGTLWTWGQNYYGQLGLGDYDRRWVPTQVGEDSDWVHVSASWEHALAMRRDGSLWAWGRNVAGELGDGGESLNLDEPKCVFSLIPGLGCD